MPRKPKVEILGPDMPDEIIDLGDAGVLMRFYAPPQPPYQRQPTDPLWWAYDYAPMAHDLKVGTDYSHASYIMKRMWELSQSTTVATMWSAVKYEMHGFERVRLDSSVTVFGAPSIYDEMVRAMIAYQERDLGVFFQRASCIAVLVQWHAAADCCEVLWANGVSYTTNPPIIRFQPAPVGGRNPSNDPTFSDRLQYLLEDLQRQPRRIGRRPKSTRAKKSNRP